MTKETGASRKPQASAREVAMDILVRVDKDRSYSNLLLNQTLQKQKLSRVDAGLVTELVYGTIQRLNTIDYYLSRFVAKGLDKLTPWVRSLLRLSFYQLYYLDRIPPHAAVSEAVNIAKKRGHTGISGMVNGVLRNVIRQKDSLVPDPGLTPSAQIAIRESHPEWLVSRYMKRYGEERARELCASNNQPPHVSVRVNPLKQEPEQLLVSMQASGLNVRPSLLTRQGLVVEGAGNMAASPWYVEGLISIQDESSMLVGAAVAPEPGMRVLDTCAAPGGKTAHMAELMMDKGTIISCDIHEHKEKLIAEQAKRLGLGSVQTIVSDAKELQALLPKESFDRILLDAPCSGLGVIRRKPDLKWQKQEQDIAAISEVQRELLEAVHVLLKPGGLLVYSTCTTEPEENEQRVEAFLNEHPEFGLEAFPPDILLSTGSTATAPTINDGQRVPTEQRKLALKEQAEHGMLQLLPNDYGTDGFFIARLRKKGEPMVK